MLLKNNAETGFHVLGEGGEFETAVFDAPLFKSHRIDLGASAEIVEKDDPAGGDVIAYLDLQELKVVPKAEESKGVLVVNPADVDPFWNQPYVEEEYKKEELPAFKFPLTEKDAPYKKPKQLLSIGKEHFFSPLLCAADFQEEGASKKFDTIEEEAAFLF